MRVGSLFTGIGGLDLGLERAGMTVKWQSEIDPFCCEVLAKHYPDVPNLGDVTKIEWESVEHVDLICGGFPCQPVSIAGRRRGEDDERWLWPEFLGAVRVVRPQFVLLENVPGLFTAGFGGVAADLASIGYELEWDCIPAAACGAPHLRDRLFAIAWMRSERGWTLAYPDDRRSLDAVRAGRDAAGDGSADVADTDSAPRSEPRSSSQAVFGPGAVERLGRCSRRLGRHWELEPAVGRVAHGIPRRVDRLRALGNAVVPQVAEFIGHQLMSSLKGTQ